MRSSTTCIYDGCLHDKHCLTGPDGKAHVVSEKSFGGVRIAFSTSAIICCHDDLPLFWLGVVLSRASLHDRVITRTSGRPEQARRSAVRRVPRRRTLTAPVRVAATSRPLRCPHPTPYLLSSPSHHTRAGRCRLVPAVDLRGRSHGAQLRSEARRSRALCETGPAARRAGARNQHQPLRAILPRPAAAAGR